MPRRSPRNHASQSAPPAPTSLRVKAANVEWLDDDAALECGLLLAIESSPRWRRGLFSDTTSAVKVRYYDEIARVLFKDHPEYGESYQSKPMSYAKAVMDKVASIPAMLAAAKVERSRATRSSASRAAREVCNDSLRKPDIWKRHRQSLPSSRWVVTYRPRLPIELQLAVIPHFIHTIKYSCLCNFLCTVPGAPICTCDKAKIYTEDSGTRCLDFDAARTACLVNKAWYGVASKQLYEVVSVRDERHYPTLFTNHGPMHQGQAGQHTKVLRLLTPPQNSMHLCVHRAIVPYVQFDFGSSDVFFGHIDVDTGKTLRDLGRSPARISALATSSVPLYQLAVCLQTPKLKLFISPEHPVDSRDEIWQDLIAGHVAALRMMRHLKHLVLDAELYLVLLPQYFRQWCCADTWRQVLDALNSEEHSPMATFFDETHITTLTFVGTHIPTLAFLSKISRAPKVERINLTGWKSNDLPKGWLEFLDAEKQRNDTLCTWSTEDPDSL